MRRSFAGGVFAIYIFCNFSLTTEASKVPSSTPYILTEHEKRDYLDATYGPEGHPQHPPNGGNKWMSKVSDNISLSELTIPGTHDSGAIYGKLTLPILR